MRRRRPASPGPRVPRRGGVYVSRRAMLLLFAVALCACEGGAPAKKAATSDAAPAPASAPVGGAAAPAPSRPVTDLLSPEPAAFPAPLSGVRFGQTRDEVKAAVPALAEDGTVAPEGWPDVRLRLDFSSDGGQLRYVQAEMPRSATAEIAARWGQGAAAKPDGSLQTTWWFDPEAGQQAVMLDRGRGRLRLNWWPLLPWKRLVGDGRKLGVETTPFLGATPEAILKAYPQYRPQKSGEEKNKDLTLQLPPHEFRTEPTFVTLDVAGGRVQRVVYRLDYSRQPALREEFPRVFRELLGAPKKVDGFVTTWTGKVPVRVEDLDALKQFDVRIGR